MRDERRREAAADREAKTPDRDRSDAETLRERMDGYVELLRQKEAEVAAAASRRATRNAAEPAAPDAARPAPKPIPTVVYAPPRQAEASGADGGTGNNPDGTPDTGARRAVPREPERPSAPLVPKWFLEQPTRPEPPYDPLRW
jgi:hypothetical protein